MTGSLIMLVISLILFSLVGAYNPGKSIFDR